MNEGDIYLKKMQFIKNFASKGGNFEEFYHQKDNFALCFEL